ncbi:MAG: hypothetical protein HFI32_13090 [Lachnospiraceae bacterium]|nr:hypothetical protein [Lachnospiraceae bacterium]
MRRLVEEQMMRKNNRTGKRLRLIPLILGGYGAFLGLGLAAIGLAEIKEGIGMVRLLIGIGMAGFGFLGIWDGVRDLVKPDKKQKQPPAIQFILTDTCGNRSSNVTVEALQKQLESLMESTEGGVFNLQILPPFAVQDIGNVSQIFCMYHETFGLTAFLDESEGGYESYHKSAGFDEAKGWLEELLTGSADLSGWNKVENTLLWEEYDEEDESCEKEESGWEESGICPGETDAPQMEENLKSFWHQLQREQKGQMRGWRQFLVIFGESWHDEHQFFSARDVELAIEGIYEGKYKKVFLEWGMQALDFFPGVQNDLMVIWCTNNTGKGDIRFLAKEGTVTQVKFWLALFLEEGSFQEMSGWTDITVQIEKANRKGKKKHGKVF